MTAVARCKETFNFLASLINGNKIDSEAAIKEAINF